MDKADLRWFLYEEHLDIIKHDGGTKEEYVAGQLKDYRALYSRRRIPYNCFDYIVNTFSSACTSIFPAGNLI
jgi:hypothetical protein